MYFIYRFFLGYYRKEYFYSLRNVLAGFHVKYVFDLYPYNHAADMVKREGKMMRDVKVLLLKKNLLARVAKEVIHKPLALEQVHHHHLVKEVLAAMSLQTLEFH